jgi:alcohol dehydrogenase class IV
MTESFSRARELLSEFKGESYAYGPGCLERAGELAAGLGRRAAVVVGGCGREWARPVHAALEASLSSAGLEVVGGPVPGSRPNAPREDVLRLRAALREKRPEVIVAAGSGSTIDAVKCAASMAALGNAHADFEEYFGVGRVSRMLAAEGAAMTPILAVQMAASSAAHLTKYSNITDPGSAQKKLIVDEAVVPPAALFDYSVTITQPLELTADGALDGMAHALEVLYGAGGEVLERVRPVALLAVDLIVGHVKRACDDPGDLEAREALGLGTDLGGYAIMIGGTGGGHLTSFSLVDVLSHGRACALTNPYYTVFFAPAIEEKLRDVGAAFRRAGYLGTNPRDLAGRELGLAVAGAMLALSRDLGVPATLDEVEGFGDEHVERALRAAKNPQLEMKLRAMPVPLSAQTVEDRMRPILEAARTGDFSLIPEVERPGTTDTHR